MSCRIEAEDVRKSHVTVHSRMNFFPFFFLCGKKEAVLDPVL